MANELNGQGLPVRNTEPYKNCNFENDGASRYFGVCLWHLVHLLTLACSFQWYVLFLCFDQTLVQHLHRDEGLYTHRKTTLSHVSKLLVIKFLTAFVRNVRSKDKCLLSVLTPARVYRQKYRYRNKHVPTATRHVTEFKRIVQQDKRQRKSAWQTLWGNQSVLPLLFCL